jgi:tungstate transport system substrate-binding protein
MSKKLFTLLLVVMLLMVCAPAMAAPPGQEAGQDYSVQAGDTLVTLAEEYLGDRTLYPAIAALTNQKAVADTSYAVIGDPLSLEIGWKIYVPTVADAQAYMAAPQTLRLSTTSSTYDTGLLDAILPDFQANFNAKVDVVAVGTGQALEMGAKGDADVVLVHARAREDKFVADGDGINRLDVMYNDFVIVGPKADPAGIAGMKTAREAFAQIAARSAPFVSRGDDSGTHTKEKSIWASASITPTAESGWYFSIGQTMGDTLVFTNEKLAYTLSDRGTWLSMQAKLADLVLLVGGASVKDNSDKILLNPYGIIPVNPEKHPGVNFPLATSFARWMTSVRVQNMIGDYGKDKFGQSLFYPTSEEYKAAQVK